MTVTYSLHVSRARLCGFAKLLMRWRGSIYKLLYREMAIFCCLYYGLLVLYRAVLTDKQRGVFEKLAIYCEAFTDLIPLSFVLGFYVAIVVGRWWQQFLAIPWPDKPCMLIAAYVHGADERGRMMRRTMARYLTLMSVLTFQGVSPAVKKRFPTLEHLEEAGLMTKEERKVYDEIPVTHGKWWVPAQWFTSLAARARKEGRIKDDIPLKALLDEMHVFRGNCGLLFSYDWISIPLVYTQVVTLAIYTYFIATVMGRQYLDPKKGYPGHDIDLYVPVFTLLQFFFYMGWLKVAEQLINPFGEDDDDFELNWCLDRNLQLSFMIVDEMHQRHPRLVRDMYWDEMEPQLPYTKSSFNRRSQPHLGSAINLDVNPEESEFLPMETIMEEDKEENNYSSPPRSPSYDCHGAPTFSLFPERKTNTNDGDSSSLSRFKLPDFSGSKLLNMIIGSNRDLSESLDSVSNKDTPGNILTAPFILKTPSGRKKFPSCSEPFGSGPPTPVPVEEKLKEDSANSLSTCRHGDGGSVDERESLMAVESIVYQEKPPDFILKIPELSIVEEEDSPSTSPRVSSPFGNSGEGHVALQIDAVNVESFPLPEPPPSPPTLYEPNSSQESLAGSSDSNQSTVNSYTELLKHEH